MKLFSKLFEFVGITDNDTGSSVKTHIPATVLDEAIEHVVDGIEPSLRYFPGYKKILNNSVATSLAYISNLVDTIPEPVFISRKDFFKDPRINAFFVTVADMQDIFSNSRELKSFLEVSENCNLNEAYALLCMSETNKTILGMDLNEDIIQREVLQTALDFSEHKILSPAASEAEVRKGIKQCIFDGLITHALQKIVKLKDQKRELEKQEFILNSRLKTRQSQSDGFSKLLASATEKKLSTDIKQKKSDNAIKLKKIPASWEVPRVYLEIIKETLSQPENFICIKEKSFDLTKMRTVASKNTSQSVETIHFQQITIADVLEKVVAIVRYPRSEILPRKEFKLPL